MFLILLIFSFTLLFKRQKEEKGKKRSKDEIRQNKEIPTFLMIKGEIVCSALQFKLQFQHVANLSLSSKHPIPNTALQRLLPSSDIPR